MALTFIVIVVVYYYSDWYSSALVCEYRVAAL